MVAGRYNRADSSSITDITDTSDCVYANVANNFIDPEEVKRKEEMKEHLEFLEDRKEITDQAKKKAGILAKKHTQNFKANNRIVKPTIRRAITPRK